ncbi:hypothetical protein [Pelagibacterium montanilacus]|uniref:hypothetical protein n=1 Tax=Pelagibacterium montanilacus TaxID=2185280 RepID=UPI000F8D5283|nr:hypothetical protein [Pelagibacterium montanilacus]
MKRSYAVLAGALLATTMFATAPANAQKSLLGIVGDKDSGAAVTVGRGDAGDSGAVNVGVGGGGGNVVDANVGSRSSGGSAARANVSVGGDSAVGVEADVLNRGDRSGVSADVNIGGGGDNGGLVDACVNVLGPNCDDGSGNGGPGGPGGPGDPMMPGGPGGVGSGGGQFGPNCDVADASALLAAISQANYSRQTIAQWSSAANVQLIQVQHCPELEAQIRAAASANDRQSLLWGISNDPLIQASLDRSRVSPQSVVLVQSNGGALNVYLL